MFSQKKQMRIPKRTLHKADKEGWNSVGFIGKRRGKDAFAVGYVDENGEAVPTGLPVIYLFDGKTVETVYGEEALELL